MAATCGKCRADTEFITRDAQGKRPLALCNVCAEQARTPAYVRRKADEEWRHSAPPGVSRFLVRNMNNFNIERREYPADR